MNPQLNDQEVLRNFLLGWLPQEQSQLIEERLLTDDAFFEELLIAEDDLVDQYLARDLSPDELRNFENHFLLTPERQQKVSFARNLKKYIAEAGDERPLEKSIITRPPKRWFSFLPFKNPAAAISFAVIALLVVGLVSFLAMRSWKRAEHEPRTIFAVSLTPGLPREGGEMKKITIPPDADTAQLRLELTADEYPRYRADLRNNENRTIYTSEDLKAETIEGRKVVAVNTPSQLLTIGDYRLSLSGVDARGSVEAINSYPFRVIGR
jgi:hypothetical protein